jgi:hydroxymethylpyrimidine pyrophosphatase-like HAD family hydrolase
MKLERTMANVYGAYIGDRYLGDLSSVKEGPLCAVDIDGVLEMRWLGFPATDPSGALSLRMLHRHGWRVAIATGRSLKEVRDRCDTYRLAGGVGEYGSVLYVHGTGTTLTLLTSADEAAMAYLRKVVDDCADVYIDPEFNHSVRLYTYDTKGNRRGISNGTMAMILSDTRVRGRLQCIPGQGQTDFVSLNVNKGKGLRALTTYLDPPVGQKKKPLAFAVGDTEWDLPMLELAEYPFAPANATPAVRRAVPTVAKPGPAGLLTVTRQQLRHKRCAHCAPPAATEDAELLEIALQAIGCGRGDKVLHALALGRRLWRRDRH